jgi:hypothetical protein
MLLKFMQLLLDDVLVVKATGNGVVTAASALPHRSDMRSTTGMDAQNVDRGDTFEGLWLLRACYPYRSDFDAQGTLNIRDAIAYGEHLLRVALADDRSDGSSQRQRAA